MRVVDAAEALRVKWRRQTDAALSAPTAEPFLEEKGKRTADDAFSAVPPVPSDEAVAVAVRTAVLPPSKRLATSAPPKPVPLPPARAAPLLARSLPSTPTGARDRVVKGLADSLDGGMQLTESASAQGEGGGTG
jgi:hypothetical protein